MSGEQNLRLIREIEANRAFLLATYRQNPALLAQTEPRIRALFDPLPAEPVTVSTPETDRLPDAASETVSVVLVVPIRPMMM